MKMLRFVCGVKRIVSPALIGSIIVDIVGKLYVPSVARRKDLLAVLDIQSIL